MDYRRKLLTIFGLILLLFVGKISIITENNVEENEIKFNTLKSDICSLYDNLSLIDNMLFERKYNPLVVIIAENFNDGLNRVRNLNDSKRILNNNYTIRSHNIHLHDMILENIYLFQYNEKYYFVYPVNIQDHFLTIYSQKKLLEDNLDITFDFINVNKENSLFEDIFITLQSSCTNCPLVKYVNEKLQKGESFSELFELRKQLFREKERKNISSTAFDSDDICTSIGFDINSKNENYFLNIDTLLKKIQSTSKKNKTRSVIVERSLSCFQSRNFELTGVLSKNNNNFKNFMITIDYLNWINTTISSLNINDTTYGGLCKNEHEIEVLDLFCFMREVSDVTSHNITAWIDALEKHAAKSLKTKLNWFNKLKYLYTNEYTMRKKYIVSTVVDLRDEILTVSENWNKLMIAAINLVSNSLGTNYEPMNNTICTVYEHWKTIDDLLLLLEVKFKKLVIIIADDMETGIRTADQIKARRVFPKVMREKLHYSEQFLYDVVMKYFYLAKSNDTYYYVYPSITDIHKDSLIGYLEYKIITDYSKVIFYFVSPNDTSSLHKVDSIIPALPSYCDKTSRNCKTHYISPLYLIRVHQEFYKRFPQYFHLYASVYKNFQEFVNNYDQHYKGNTNIAYFVAFRNFLKQQISFDVNYLFNGLPCASSKKLNRRTDVDFPTTEEVKISDISKFYGFLYSAKESIIISENENNTLHSLCNKKEIFKFLKYFCFLKINYIDGLLRVIDQQLGYSSYLEMAILYDKNVTIEYLSQTINWMNKLFSINFNDYKYNEKRIYNLSKSLYSQIPEITLNGADMSNKIYSIIKNNTIFLHCNKYYTFKQIP